jgi:hypothetical protein
MHDVIEEFIYRRSSPPTDNGAIADAEIGATIDKRKFLGPTQPRVRLRACRIRGCHPNKH